eukprot:1195259-Prorocentrum_minimum.AAC.1
MRSLINAVICYVQLRRIPRLAKLLQFCIIANPIYGDGRGPGRLRSVCPPAVCAARRFLSVPAASASTYIKRMSTYIKYTHPPPPPARRPPGARARAPGSPPPPPPPPPPPLRPPPAGRRCA